MDGRRNYGLFLLHNNDGKDEDNDGEWRRMAAATWNTFGYTHSRKGFNRAFDNFYATLLCDALSNDNKNKEKFTGPIGAAVVCRHRCCFLLSPL